MSKKKIIGLVLILLIVGALAYYFFIYSAQAAPWDSLSDEEKIIEWDNFLSGTGSVYVRPGTDEFQDLLDEMQQLYAANGIAWDEDEFTTAYVAANGDQASDDGSTNAYNPDEPISVSNRPGTTNA